MLERILNTIIYSVGLITLTMLALFVVINIVEQIQIKIKKGKDPKVNIKHINRLIKKIKRQGWRVEVHYGYEYGISDKPLKTYKPIDGVRLSKTWINNAGIELDEDNNVVS